MMNKKFLVDVTRQVLNSKKDEYLRSDFSDCCETACSIMYYILANYTEEIDYHIIRGQFNGMGHTWMVISGEMVDPTVDQFSNDYSIYSCRLYEHLYNAESEDFHPLLQDEYMDYIDMMFQEDKERYNFTKLRY